MREDNLQDRGSRYDLLLADWRVAGIAAAADALGEREEALDEEEEEPAPTVGGRVRTAVAREQAGECVHCLEELPKVEHLLLGPGQAASDAR